MSVNIPPNPNVSTFNNLYWIGEADAFTTAEGDLRYLKFPVAQGTENLQATNVNGVLTANDDISVADGVNISTINQTGTRLSVSAPVGGTIAVSPSLTFPDTSVQTTAFATITPSPAGTYSAPSSVVVNSSGQITSATNGTPYTLPSPAPTAGSYTNSNITINAAGQVTAASNGSGGTIPSALTPNSLTITPTSIPSSTAGIYNYYNQGAQLCFSGSGGANNGATNIFAANDGVIWDFNYNYIPNAICIKYRITFTFWNGSNWGQTKCDIDFFPVKWTQGQQSNDKYNINNKINGNANYNYTDATYAPTGRQYWTYNQSFSGISGSQGQFLPHQGYWYLYFAIPDNSYQWSGCIEALDTTAAQRIGLGVTIGTI
jgi:hypothetical protein